MKTRTLILLFALAQGLDALLTYYSVGWGLLRETNPWIDAFILHWWFIPLKIGIAILLALWIGDRKYRRMPVLYAAMVVSFGVVIFNALCLSVAV